MAEATDVIRAKSDCKIMVGGGPDRGLREADRARITEKTQGGDDIMKEVNG